MNCEFTKLKKKLSSAKLDKIAKLAKICRYIFVNIFFFGLCSVVCLTDFDRNFQKLTNKLTYVAEALADYYKIKRFLV